MEITRKLIEKKVGVIFPEGEAQRALETLDRYEGAERERVQLAVLRLSGGRLRLLRKALSAAKVDYRDVLGWAEFPREMKHSFKQITEMGAEAAEALRAEDRRDYLGWLEADGGA